MKINKIKLKLISFTFTAFILNTAVIAGDAAAGKAVYDGAGACATCHGVAGAGDGAAAIALPPPKPTNFVTANFRLDTDADGKLGTSNDISNVIKNGALKYAGNAIMAARADLTDAQIKDLVAYINSLKK
jgi:mono/diheme cytochrome c family protein